MSQPGPGIKTVPYGVSDFEQLVVGNHYYVDKTPWLKTIEAAGYYLFFIRPRRFGKSLFITMMEGYYDICYKERFRELFRDTYIVDNPTKEQGTYLVYVLNFSRIDTAPDKVGRIIFETYKNHDKLLYSEIRRLPAAGPGAIYR